MAAPSASPGRIWYGSESISPGGGHPHWLCGLVQKVDPKFRAFTSAPLRLSSPARLKRVTRAPKAAAPSDTVSPNDHRQRDPSTSGASKLDDAFTRPDYHERTPMGETGEG